MNLQTKSSMHALRIMSLILWLSPGLHTNAQTDIGQSVPVTRKGFLDDPENFQFVIVGDRTGGHRPGVFEKAMYQVNLLQPEFVLGVGDLIEGYIEEEQEIEAQWEEVESMIDSLQMPFFYVAGNHDISNPVMANLWRERRGQDYYHFLYKNVLFIALNTEDPPFQMPPELLSATLRMEQAMASDPRGTQDTLLARARALREESGGEDPVELPGSVNISQAQVEFVRQTLNENQNVRWTFLLMHKPAWKSDNSAFSEIEQMLKDRDYTVVAGHEHYYAHTERSGANYIVMGTTGGIWLEEGPGTIDHISWVTMTEEGPVFATIRIDGLSDVSGLPINGW